jgi:hypothetical protein
MNINVVDTDRLDITNRRLIWRLMKTAISPKKRQSPLKKKRHNGARLPTFSSIQAVGSRADGPWS